MPRKVGSVLLYVDGCHFQVDRQMLASQSEYFRVLFRSKTQRDQHGALIVPGNAERFGLILDYLQGDYRLSNEQLKWILADGTSLYRISSLVYLAQLTSDFQVKERRTMNELKHTINKMERLKRELAKLEIYIDKLNRS